MGQTTTQTTPLTTDPPETEQTGEFWVELHRQVLREMARTGGWERAFRMRQGQGEYKPVALMDYQTRTEWEGRAHALLMSHDWAIPYLRFLYTGRWANNVIGRQLAAIAMYQTFPVVE